VRKLSLITTALAGALLLIVPTTAQAATTVKTFTFNIHHGAGTDGKLDLERTAKTIEASGAGIVGLQEVDKNFDARSNWVDQAAWLATRLGMNYVFAANLDWDPPEAGKPRRQYGTAVLSKYPITDSRNTLLPKVGDEEQRGLLETVVNVDGTPVRFADTHLNNATAAERQQQATAIVNLLGSATEPTVLVGDLNAVPSAAEIKTLTARWKDTWTEVGVGLGYTSAVPFPTRRIDYVLHSTALKATAASVPSSLASDHLPVSATFTLG
jgi:endonuclease/exonuclease/phosphatase family metal-dependent hydrolase